MVRAAGFLDRLEVEVSPFRKRVLESPLLAQLREGTLTRDHYARFLVEVFHYAKHTPRLLAAAASRLGSECRELAARFLENAREEAGHDLWALADLRAMGHPTDRLADSVPLPSTEALVAYSYYLVNYVDPRGLLGPNYALETLGSGVATDTALRVKEVLGVDDRAVRFLAGHGAADQHHVLALRRVTASFATSADVQALVVRGAQAVYTLYAGMLAEVWSEVRTASPASCVAAGGVR
jgi:3-oxoacyl-[acyl-carrier-protein] synthase III